MRGFYMSIDIAVAAAFAMFSLIIIVISLGNITGSAMIDAANYKLAESSLYTLENAGTLDDVVHFMDIGNPAQASKRALKDLKELELTLNTQLSIQTYDNNMVVARAITVQTGSVGKRAYAVSIPFRPGDSASKYGIATLVMGA